MAELEETIFFEKLPEYFTTTQCQHKLDNIVKDGEAFKLIGFRKLSKVLILNVKMNNDIEQCIIVATQFLRVNIH